MYPTYYNSVGMKVLVSNIYSKLITDNKKLLDALRSKYTCKVPGYQYMEKYKKGFWDGSKHFFSKNGKFRTGLLEAVLADLDYLELDYEVDYLSEEESPVSNYEIPGSPLRDYQELIIESALEAKRSVIQAPTAAGKTHIMAALLQAMGDRCGVILFNTKTVLVQTYETLKGMGFDVGVAFGEGVDIKNVTLCTVQSIQKIVPTHLHNAKFLMVDEVHEFSRGKVTTAAIGSFPNATYRYGFTATVPNDRFARLNLVSRVGSVINEVSVKSLIDEGWLTDYNLHIIESLSEQDVADEAMSYQEIYEKYIVYNEERNNKIVDIVNDIQEHPSHTLILVKNLDHAKILHELIPGSYKLEGKDDVATRKAVIKKFCSARHAVIIGTKIFQTGVNIPEITHLINARGLRSEIATIQALGRALRIHDSKSQVEIYDFNDKAKYLREHSRKRIDTYKRLKR